jgi:hypothetical protein
MYELEVEIAAYCEHKLNMKHMINSNGFSQLFQRGKVAISSVVTVHENTGRMQQERISLHLFGHLTEQLDHNKSGKDKTGFGQWTVMTFQGDGACTCIVCRYNPCGNNQTNRGTIYQQHRISFLTKQKDLPCPQIHYHDDLIEKLTEWQ